MKMKKAIATMLAKWSIVCFVVIAACSEDEPARPDVATGCQKICDAVRSYTQRPECISDTCLAECEEEYASALAAKCYEQVRKSLECCGEDLRQECIRGPEETPLPIRKCGYTRLYEPKAAWEACRKVQDELHQCESDYEAATGYPTCTDANLVCTELRGGSEAAFAKQCHDAGNTFRRGSCAGAKKCTGGSGTANGQAVQIDLHWPGDICGKPDYTDKIYLKGTCSNVLNGTYFGDADSCCTGTTRPAVGGTVCNPG